MVFFPSTTLVQTPENWGLIYEDVFLETKDGVHLHSWFIPHPDATQTLLFFHGNAGNISHRGKSVEIFHRLGLNVFILGYRGYGESQGKPSETGLYKDALSAWHYLLEERSLNPQDIILFGRSLGGSIAAELATEVQPGGLILESTFSSARDMADIILPLISRLVYLRYEFDTLTKLTQITVPVLILHSPDDEIIPFRLGEKTYQAANEPKTFVIMKGGHNNGFLMSQPDYEQAFHTFITQVQQQGQSLP